MRWQAQVSSLAIAARAYRAKEVNVPEQEESQAFRYPSELRGDGAALSYEVFGRRRAGSQVSSSRWPAFGRRNARVTRRCAGR